MKKIIITLFSLGFAVAAFAVDAAIAGAWKVDTDAAGNASTSTLTLKQDGNKLSGSIKGADGQVLSVTGAVEGDKVEWKYVKDWQGNPLTITYTGKIDAAGVITGSTDVQPMGIEGSFVAKKEEKK